MKSRKTILVSVTNDISTDQRVHKVCLFLHENGFEVTLIGRKRKNSQPLSRIYHTKRFRLWFNKGALFYMNYNLRLFFFLLFKRSDVLLSNDLDSLLPNFIVSRLKGKKLVYDSHEYFTEVPELNGRKFVKSVWLRIEKRIFPKLKYVYTVNQSLAEIYTDKYGVDVKVLKNVPFYVQNQAVEKFRTPTVIYQGALNKDRGLEELIGAFQFCEGIHLILAGDGDLTAELKLLIQQLNLGNKVRFLGRIRLEELREITLKAHLGVSLEKATNLNYYYALPNKIFDYISCNLPVLCSALPEMKKIIETHQVGEVLDDIRAEKIAEKLMEMLTDSSKMESWISHTKKAAKSLCWENEYTVLTQIYLSDAAK